MANVTSHRHSICQNLFNQFNDASDSQWNKTGIRENGIEKSIRQAIFRQDPHQQTDGQFADFVFRWDYDMFGDGSKLRRAGFNGYQATDEMFFNLFAQLRAARIIP